MSGCREVAPTPRAVASRLGRNRIRPPITTAPRAARPPTRGWHARALPTPPRRPASGRGGRGTGTRAGPWRAQRGTPRPRRSRTRSEWPPRTQSTLRSRVRGRRRGPGRGDAGSGRRRTVARPPQHGEVAVQKQLQAGVPSRLAGEMGCRGLDPAGDAGLAPVRDHARRLDPFRSEPAPPLPRERSPQVRAFVLVLAGAAAWRPRRGRTRGVRASTRTLRREPHPPPLRRSRRGRRRS